MGLEKLTIQVEQEGGKLVFDNKHTVTALFNPSRLAFNRTVNWGGHDAAQRDSPELQFTGSEPATLNVDLFFDTYDTPGPKKPSVRDHTDQLLYLTTVHTHGSKHRPPVCRLFWGQAGLLFQGVLQSLEQQFTLFTEDGTPVRATLRCGFKEWRSNKQDLNLQNKQSSDVVKVRTIKRGESLSSIAAEEYRDARRWQPIARANGIDDPLAVAPGTALAIPRLEA